MTSEKNHPSSNLTKTLIHPWCKFGPNVTNICEVIVFTSENIHVEIDPPGLGQGWIGQGHPSSNLTKKHQWYKFELNATNILLSCRVYKQ